MRLRKTMTGLLGLLIALQIGGVSSGEPSIEALVGSAASPASHAEIAMHYREKATEMRELSAMHRRLAEIYGGDWVWGVAFSNYQSRHCEELANNQEQMAIEYENLAIEHEKLAGGCPPRAPISMALSAALACTPLGTSSAGQAAGSRRSDRRDFDSRWYRGTL